MLRRINCLSCYNCATHVSTKMHSSTGKAVCLPKRNFGFVANPVPGQSHAASTGQGLLESRVALDLEGQQQAYKFGCGHVLT